MRFDIAVDFNWKLLSSSDFSAILIHSKVQLAWEHDKHFSVSHKHNKLAVEIWYWGLTNSYLVMCSSNWVTLIENATCSSVYYSTEHSLCSILCVWNYWMGHNEIGRLYQNTFDGFEFGPCQLIITARDVCSVGLLCYYIDWICCLILGNGKDIVTSKGL